MAINKQAANFRAARKSGVKPGSRTLQADGTLGGGTKLPARRPLPPLPTNPIKAEPLNPINGTGRPRDPIGGPAPGQTPGIVPRPRNPNQGGVSTLPTPAPPSGIDIGVMEKPYKVPGGPVMSPQPMPPGMEAGKADMVDARMGGVMNQMAPYDGPMPSGGIYAGGQTAIGAMPGAGGGMNGSVGADGGGPMGGPIDGPMGAQDPSAFLSQIQLPKRFQGNAQAAMEFMRKNPQSRLGQSFGQYNQGRGLGQFGPNPNQPISYNPLLQMG